MEIAELEHRFGLEFCVTHRRVLADNTDPIHEACDILAPSSEYPLLRFADVNAFLRRPENSDPWPEYLVAFASNGCGDYYAYDLRSTPPTIIYIDPQDLITENLAAEDRLTFADFNAWYDAKLGGQDELSV